MHCCRARSACVSRLNATVENIPADAAIKRSRAHSTATWNGSPLKQAVAHCTGCRMHMHACTSLSGAPCAKPPRGAGFREEFPSAVLGANDGPSTFHFGSGAFGLGPGPECPSAAAVVAGLQIHY